MNNPVSDKVHNLMVCDCRSCKEYWNAVWKDSVSYRPLERNTGKVFILKTMRS